jgi:hypothetical protein
MILPSFADELVRHTAGRQALCKVAKASPSLVGRMAATGALSSGAYHAGSRAKSSLSRDPSGGPEGTLGSALSKGAIGGLLAAALVKALTRMGR